MVEDKAIARAVEWLIHFWIVVNFRPSKMKFVFMLPLNSCAFICPKNWQSSGKNRNQSVTVKGSPNYIFKSNFSFENYKKMRILEYGNPFWDFFSKVLNFLEFFWTNLFMQIFDFRMMNFLKFSCLFYSFFNYFFQHWNLFFEFQSLIFDFFLKNVLKIFINFWSFWKFLKFSNPIFWWKIEKFNILVFSRKIWANKKNKLFVFWKP